MTRREAREAFQMSRRDFNNLVGRMGHASQGRHGPTGHEISPELFQKLERYLEAHKRLKEAREALRNLD